MKCMEEREEQKEGGSKKGGRGGEGKKQGEKMKKGGKAEAVRRVAGRKHVSKETVLSTKKV